MYCVLFIVYRCLCVSICVFRFPSPMLFSATCGSVGLIYSLESPILSHHSHPSLNRNPQSNPPPASYVRRTLSCPINGTCSQKTQLNVWCCGICFAAACRNLSNPGEAWKRYILSYNYLPVCVCVCVMGVCVRASACACVCNYIYFLKTGFAPLLRVAIFRTWAKL
ncbi:hypothetical protein T492DRAFT_216105 [Pavlovales sp. CCMP2436]|nr:hypothetical protein T492DRAFT_216105 [Pavlovales sp. CCMP2436]